MESDTQKLQTPDSPKRCKCKCKKLTPCCQPPTKTEIGVVVGSLVTYIIIWIAGGAYAAHSNLFGPGRRKESSGFTPPPAAFKIWGFIYLWGFIFMIYTITALFVRGLHRAPMYVYPVYVLTGLGGTMWMVCAANYWYWGGVVAITAMPITLYIIVSMSIEKARQHGLHTSTDPRKFFIYTYLVDNSFALYAGWVSVAYLLYLAQALIYDVGYDKVNVGTGCLTWLFVKLAIFLSLEVTLLDKYMRHIWAHYFALTNAVVGSILNNYDPDNRNTLITIGLAGALLVAFMVKVLRILVGKCQRPQVDECEDPEQLMVESGMAYDKAGPLPEKVDLSLS